MSSNFSGKSARDDFALQGRIDMPQTWPRLSRENLTAAGLKRNFMQEEHFWWGITQMSYQRMNPKR